MGLGFNLYFTEVAPYITGETFIEGQLKLQLQVEGYLLDIGCVWIWWEISCKNRLGNKNELKYLIDYSTTGQHKKVKLCRMEI